MPLSAPILTVKVSAAAGDTDTPKLPKTSKKAAQTKQKLFTNEEISFIVYSTIYSARTN
jgi:hypothetical protein